MSGAPDGSHPAGDEAAVSSAGDGAWQGRFPPVRLSAPGLVAAAGVLGTIVLLWAVRDTLPVFVVGLLFAYLLSPLVRWMTGHRVPRGYDGEWPPRDDAITEPATAPAAS